MAIRSSAQRCPCRPLSALLSLSGVLSEYTRIQFTKRAFLDVKES